MPHPRTQIRDAIVTALVGTTAAGSRVYETLWVAGRRASMPYISVAIVQESVDNDGDSAPREYFRRPEIKIEAFIGDIDATDIDEMVDDLALEIEAAMAVDRTFGGLLSDSWLDSTSIEVDTEGDRLTAHLTITYSALYFTYPDNPTIADEFVTVEAAHDLGADAPATDVFNVKELP